MKTILLTEDKQITNGTHSSHGWRIWHRFSSRMWSKTSLISVWMRGGKRNTNQSDRDLYFYIITPPLPPPQFSFIDLYLRFLYSYKCLCGLVIVCSDLLKFLLERFFWQREAQLFCFCPAATCCALIGHLVTIRNMVEGGASFTQLIEDQQACSVCVGGAKGGGGWEQGQGCTHSHSSITSTDTHLGKYMTQYWTAFIKKPNKPKTSTFPFKEMRSP